MRPRIFFWGHHKSSVLVQHQLHLSSAAMHHTGPSDWWPLPTTLSAPSVAGLHQVGPFSCGVLKKKALTGRPAKLFDPPSQHTHRHWDAASFVFICLEARSDRWVRTRRRHFRGRSTMGGPGEWWSVRRLGSIDRFDERFISPPSPLSAVNGRTPPVAGGEMEGQPISGWTAEPQCCLGK